ncbi:MAG: LuxR C-terminal-related transcriptional regulator [Myxococcota bacterium]|nr:LuxR C-terminal-related transcriptional regulator [Myxococcota bacterium]
MRPPGRQSSHPSPAGPGRAGGPAVLDPAGAGPGGPPPGSPARQLQERVKEQACLYGIIELVLHRDRSLDTVLQAIVDLLPGSLQHPAAAGASLEFQGREYRSAAADALVVRLTRPIRLEGALVGRVTLGYTRLRGPASRAFLREERQLLTSVAHHIGLVIGRTQAEQALEAANRQLELEQRALIEANIALRTLAERLHDEKRAIAGTLRTNLEHTVEPLLAALRQEAPAAVQSHLDLLQRCLDDLVSPFLELLGLRAPALTPTERAVCVLIRSGLTTKEIARRRGVAAGTVSVHRESIRRKLGLRNGGRNLAAYLQGLDLGEDGGPAAQRSPLIRTR